ncbi:Holliday junction resolvase YqgF [Stanieria sp. NIES-3757]|nr:Holliday junction resolvase YqgF [Stanieria sp. NIES-3757]
MKRILALGLDVGQKRLGVAGCDGTGLIATAITTIKRSSFQQDVAKLKAIVLERQVEVLVVGLPYSMDGSIGFQAKQVQKFTQRISQALQLPVEYVDERLTSVEAEAQLKTQKRFSLTQKELIDAQAAAIILQQWLDERRQN